MRLAAQGARGVPPRAWLVGVLLGIVAASAAAQTPDAEARRLAPWLDVPAGWVRRVENGVVAVMPNDLPTGAQLVIMVEPPSTSSETLDEAYERALRDLGPWRPVAEPLEDRMANGWAFRHGLGVVTLNGRNFTGHTAVARSGDRLVRMWVLAESDATYNRYRSAILTAIASAQDIATAVAATPVPADAPAPAAAPALPQAIPTVNPDSLTLVTGFGTGVSGVYVGVERSVMAMAGVGPGGGTAPASQIGDFAEVHVFFADGTFRQRMPIRGLATDLAWERGRIPVLWGTWTRDGDRVTVRRGGFTSTYTIDGADLLDDRGRPWVKLPVPEHVTLDGTYVRDDFRDPDAPRLILRADGTYEDRGGFVRMVGLSWHLLVPDGDALSSGWTDAQGRQIMAGGSGTYTYDAFSLTLRDVDRRVWRINAYIPAGQTLPRPERLVINGRALVRLPEPEAPPSKP